MYALMFVFTALLFFVLTPGILLSLPPKGSKIVVAATHAIVFAVVYSLTHKLVYSYLYEGFVPTTKKKPVTAQKTVAKKPAMKAAKKPVMNAAKKP